jgi:hypothetical protein
MRGGETIVCDPAELGCHVGGGGSSSQQSAQQTSSGSSFGQSANQSLTLPQNFQNSQFTNLAPNIGTVQNLLSNPGGVGVTSTGNAQHPDINAWTVGNQGISSSSSQNPLVAQVTGAQNQTLGQIGQTVGQNSQTLSPGFNALQPELAGGNQFATSLAGGLPTNSAFNNLLSSGYAGAAAGGNPVNSTLASILDPNFASGLATSPQTQAAIQSALSPVRQQFNTQQVPGLEGSFTQAGQRVGSSSGMGSSAFQNAYANAQGTELSNEANIAGQISNQAYQTGLGMTNSAAQLLQGEGSNLYGQGLATSANAAQALQSAQGNLYGTGASIAANAPSQLASLSQTELNNLISGLNAQALPQLTQQYGITAGTQLYQQQVSTILQALGLGVQAAQPVLGYGSESTGGSQQASTSESQGTSQGSSHSSQFSLSNPFSFG